MNEYIIIDNVTGLIIDSFTSEALCFPMIDYQTTGIQCHMEIQRN